MRSYEEISLGDLIDETFGPSEFDVDRILYHRTPHEIAAILHAAAGGEIRLLDTITRGGDNDQTEESA